MGVNDLYARFMKITVLPVQFFLPFPFPLPNNGRLSFHLMSVLRDYSLLKIKPYTKTRLLSHTKGNLTGLLTNKLRTCRVRISA